MLRESWLESTLSATSDFRPSKLPAVIGLRHKLYKTFISPFIEMFTPIVVQDKIGAITPAHRLQHHSLCAILKVPICASRRRLEIGLGEKSVEEKAQNMAARVIKALGMERPTFDECGSSRALRSHRNTAEPIRGATKPVDRKDNTLRLFLFQSTEFEKTNKVKFNAKQAAKLAKSINELIKTKVLQR